MLKNYYSHKFSFSVFEKLKLDIHYYHNSLFTSLMAIMSHLGSEDHCVGGEEDGEAQKQESGPDHGGRWRENGKHSLVEPLLSILSQPPFLAPALPRILYWTCHLTFSPLEFIF